jgi:hypothetical protein
MTKRTRNARRRLKANYTLIVLHSLYQRWGLPTALLKPKARKADRL